MDKTNILNISDLVVDEKYSKNYVCLRCGKLFHHRGLLNRHLKTKNPCPIKHLNYTRDELIQDYYKLIKKNNKKIDEIVEDHEISSSCVCVYCGKKTKTQRGLKQHIYHYCNKINLLDEQYKKTVQSINDTINIYNDYTANYKIIYKLKECDKQKYVILANESKTIDKLQKILNQLKPNCNFTKNINT
jgi:hypothetical protein